MIAKFVTAIALLAAVEGATTAKSWNNPLQGVDPNTLSCDPEGHVFLLLPHFTDCHKFFMCAHGEEVEFTCAGGTIFDFEAQTCNWDWAVECVLRTPLDEEEGSGDDADMIGMFGHHLENEPVDMVASVRPISPMLSKYNSVLNCQRADDGARRLPYKGDCQRYWRCIAGVPQIDYCTDGLFFNDLTQECDFEANVKCNVIPDEELQGEFLVYN